NRSIQIQRISGSHRSYGSYRTYGFGLLILARRDLRPDVPRDQVHGEQIPQAVEVRVFLELRQVRVRHSRPQLGHALRGDLAVLDELGVALEDRFREQLAAGDLDAELALQPEHDVQEVDRLGPQVTHQCRLRVDLVLVDVQRLDERRGHLLIDLV